MNRTRHWIIHKDMYCIGKARTVWSRSVKVYGTQAQEFNFLNIFYLEGAVEYKGRYVGKYIH